MKGGDKVWWVLKLASGLVLIGCLLAVALIVLMPDVLQHAGAWLVTSLTSAALYALAERNLAARRRPTVVAEWRGTQFVLPAPFVRQTGWCLVSAGITATLAVVVVRARMVPLWETAFLVAGVLFGAWITRASVLGLLNLRRAGFALKLDAAGIHYPGLPLLRWTLMRALAIEPPRADSEQSQCLVVEMKAVPDRPSGLLGSWRATVRRHRVMLPLPTLGRSSPLLAAAQGLWRRHGRREQR